MKKIVYFISILFCLLLTGCFKPSNPTIESIVVENKEIVLYIGTSETIKYKLQPNGVDGEIVWSVTDPTIVTLEGGVVTGRNYGNTYITLVSKSNELISERVHISVIRRTFNITYELNGGSFTYDVPFTYEENTGISNLPLPVKEEHIFIGWYLNDELVESIDSSVNEDITLVAKWEKIYIPQTFNINYELDGGYFEEDVENTFVENIGLSELPTPVKEEYNFIGWYLNDELVESIDSSVNEDITLVAKWEKIYIPQTFNINYELDGGYFEEDVENTFVENIGLSELPTPVKEEYNFIGWYLNDELVTFIDPSTNQNVTLVAKWQKNVDIAAAKLIVDLINSLPYHITYNDKLKIDFIKQKYDELNNQTKELVTNIEELNQKISKIENIEQDTSTITYVLGDHIYVSKEELFKNFFSDFYKYIVTYHGDEYLKNNSVININNIDEFVELAGNFNGAGYSNLYGIGHLAGRYMLVRDVNGVIENQPESGFIGYCYQNGLYKDLLPFFIRFFAYWRIDEKYANESNYGADIFAEGWAPTVDIAKFFYYTEDNLPTKALYTERMIDCFTNIASVIYTELPTTPSVGMILPTEVKLRGYVFEGWYDNPEFTGEKITRIDDVSKKIILYAKWSIDNSSFDKDSSEIVDIYIYNLTTEPANVTKQTVKYVRDMYDKLSENGKSLVKSYNILLEFEEKYADLFLEPVDVNVKTQVEGDLSLNEIKEDFIIDFNVTTNSNIISLDELSNNKYTYMKKVKQFFNNDAMRSKWIYLLDILYEEGCFVGLEIQINRIKENENGDLEYVTSALGLLLSGSDASSNKEVLVDYSKSEKTDLIIKLYGTYQMTFEKSVHLPTININGYEFLGFYDLNNNLITKATEDMPTDLIAVYRKK